MAKSPLKLVKPTTENRTVTPVRRKNAELRTREYLTDGEVEQLTDAAKANRYGQRDATMILVAYRHGLRVSELVDLRWDQIDFNTATLHVRRVKKRSPSTHPILGDELRALRRLAREQDPKSPFVFTSQRGAPFTTAGFARMLERVCGCRAGLQGSPPHAQARLWLCTGEQGARYAGAAGLPGPQEYPAHGPLHRIVAGSVQGLLEIGPCVTHSWRVVRFAPSLSRWRPAAKTDPRDSLSHTEPLPRSSATLRRELLYSPTSHDCCSRFRRRPAKVGVPTRRRHHATRDHRGAARRLLGLTAAAEGGEPSLSALRFEEHP